MLLVSLHYHQLKWLQIQTGAQYLTVLLRSLQIISETDLEAGEKLSGNMTLKTASAMTL